MPPKIGVERQTSTSVDKNNENANTTVQVTKVRDTSGQVPAEAVTREEMARMTVDLVGKFASHQQGMMEDMVRHLGQPSQTARNEGNVEGSHAQESYQPVVQPKNLVGRSFSHSMRSGRSL